MHRSLSMSFDSSGRFRRAASVAVSARLPLDRSRVRIRRSLRRIGSGQVDDHVAVGERPAGVERGGAGVESHRLDTGRWRLGGAWGAWRKPAGTAVPVLPESAAVGGSLSHPIRSAASVNAPRGPIFHIQFLEKTNLLKHVWVGVGANSMPPQQRNSIEMSAPGRVEAVGSAGESPAACC